MPLGASFLQLDYWLGYGRGPHLGISAARLQNLAVGRKSEINSLSERPTFTNIQTFGNLPIE